MKNTIGFIFLFAVINGSYSKSLRELDFIGSLYPQGIPKQLLTSMVARRIDQVKTLSGHRSIPKDAKTFYNSTEQSLQLLLKSMNDTPISDATKYYSNVVELKGLPRDELQAMMDAYIDDIEMVRVYEVSFGHSDRVDMEIVDRLKSLSNDLKNLNVYRDDEILYEEQSLARRAMDQCLLQLRFLLDQFTETFVFY